jgi:hypothetical protein
MLAHRRRDRRRRERDPERAVFAQVRFAIAVPEDNVPMPLAPRADFG